MGGMGVLTVRDGWHLLVLIGIWYSLGIMPQTAPVPAVEAGTGDNPLPAGFSLLHGTGKNDRLKILLLGYNGTTDQMLKETADNLFVVPPTNEFSDKTSVYKGVAQADLGCDQQGKCNQVVVESEIRRIISLTRIVFHETLIVAKSNDNSSNGWARVETFVKETNTGNTFNNGASILTYAAIVRPEILANEDHKRIITNIIAHEKWGHSYDGDGHKGPGVMEDIDKSFFNDEQTNSLKKLFFESGPYMYNYPENQINAQSLATNSLGYNLNLTYPDGTTANLIQVKPFNNDGPGVSAIVSPTETFTLNPPKFGEGNYTLLPDMTYTGSLCSTGVNFALTGVNDSNWTQHESYPGKIFTTSCPEVKFHTPKRYADKITPVSPKPEEVVADLRPAITWANADTDVFYYQLQVSKDASFNTVPATAIAAVFDNLVHGGVSVPLNSWTPPAGTALELGATYYWRVRPRIQGDGSPAEWSATWSFSTAGAR